MKKSINEIRKTFLEFFEKKNHKIIPGSSIIPKNDSSLLFTNAGMNQFKDVFLGKKEPIFPRVATVQNCLRTGGKHNDLNNVGYTSYHNTFFEMLGNFSFRDYFKEDAIIYAWELLTSSKWFNLPEEKLLVTIHSSDKETYNIWKNIIGLSENQIIPLKKEKEIFLSENFWKMGNSGPCGPCTEIFFNNTQNKEHQNKDILVENNNYLEIWNIVFIQYNLQSDGSLIDLPYKSVDTGMGLERITSILQRKKSNYKIDLFQKLIFYIANQNNIKDLENKSLHIIADHIRTCIYIISSGVIPSNEGKGYILRRLIRRALRHGLKLGIKEKFLYKIVPYTIKLIKKFSNGNMKKKEEIGKILKLEEDQFLKILKKGIILLHENIKKIKKNILPGKIIFSLHDTFGFPIDLIEEICKEKKIILDYQKFNQLMEAQKIQSKKSKKFFFEKNYQTFKIKPTIFLGYQEKKIKTTITNIFLKENSIKKIQTLNKKIILILKETPFYSESGGQIGDTGKIYNKNFSFLVEDTKKNGLVTMHFGRLISGEIKINANVTAEIDFKKRKLIAINHSATHLLHSSLNIVLNQKILQKGSLVNEKYLRFDFLYPNSISQEEIKKIEKIVNYKIWENLNINCEIISFKEAKEKNAIFLKNKQYTEKVRLLSIDNFSHELCGGTHARRTGEIGIFKIISNNSISANVCRIEALTRKEALLSIQKKESIFNKIKKNLKEEETKIVKKINFLLEKNSYLKLIYKKYEKYKIKETTKKILKESFLIKKTNLVIYHLNEKKSNFLNCLINNLKNNLNSFIIILTNETNKKISVLVSVSKELITKITAVEIINFITKEINGKGGGNKENAQGGGIKPKNNNFFIKKSKKWILSILESKIKKHK
ncbi:alanine--tRNA ligase [Buchnera aphidicola]|uniref:alanine--tRNA ligase n=1 Tax=Buchnera aphidicola TaxID=9 RepID=UPI0031B6D0D4